MITSEKIIEISKIDWEVLEKHWTEQYEEDYKQFLI
jgi:hypothetical protein